MAFPDSDIQSISGAPQPPPPLSGLLFGSMGLSNTGQGSEGGTLAGGRGGPGMQAGPGLDILSLISQLSGSGGEGGPGAGISPLALGQQAGGLGAGSFGQAGVQSPFFQTIGQQGIAGGGGAQPGGQGGTGTQGDILSLLKALTSVGQKGTDLFSALQSQSGGTDLQSGTGQVGGYTLGGQPGTASPTTGGGSLAQDLTGGLTGTNILQDPTLQLFNQGLLTGSLTPQSLEAFNTLPTELQQQYANALFGGKIGPSLGESFQTGGGGGGFSLGVSPLSAEGAGGAGSLFGNLGLGDLGAGFGALGGLTGLAGDIKSGNIGGSIKDLYGLYSQAAPYLSQLTGGSFPTIGSFFSGLGSAAGGGLESLGLGSLGAGATALEGAGASAALGGAAGESVGAGLAAGTEAAGAGLGVAGAGLAGIVAYPAIQAILNGISQMFGAGFSEQEQNKLKGNLAEFKRNVGNFQRIFPTYQEGLRLPQEFQQLAGQFSGMDRPQEIAGLQALNAKAQNIMNQGPAISQMYAGQWGPFKNPIGRGALAAMSPQAAQNAIATSIRTQEMLSQLGAAPTVANMGPLELAQWAGNYGGIPQGQNPAYGTTMPSEYGPGFAGYDVPATASQFSQFQNPATLESMLAQYVGGAGGNYGASSLAQILGKLPQIPQGFGLPQSQWNTQGFMPQITDYGWAPGFAGGGGIADYGGGTTGTGVSASADAGSSGGAGSY